MHFLFGAGGTGGHLYPALAVADALIKLNPAFRITFAGRSDKIEGQKVSMFGYEFMPLSIDGFSLKPSFSSARSAIKLIKARNQLIKFIKQNKCDAVIVAGAYISIPPGFAAVSTKTPLFLMESNVNPGKAISLLSARSKAIFTSFEDSKNYFPSKLHKKIHFTGNPVRADFEQETSTNNFKVELGFDSDKPLLLAFGGSLGAASINHFMQVNIGRFSDINVVWQTGGNYQIPENLPNNVKAYNYIDNMALYYRAADLIVSRSGASTISELTLTSKPSILIPLPSASNNEQLRNAEIMFKLGASVLVEDKNIESNLFNIVYRLIFDNDKLSNMSSKAKLLAMPNAADNIAKKILSTIGYDGNY